MAVAVIAAMTQELAPFLDEQVDTQAQVPPRVDATVHFYPRVHQGFPLVIVKSGLGKVNAAIAAQTAIDRFAVKAVIQVGLAGAVDTRLKQGDIVLGERYLEHDVDLTQVGLRPGTSVFDAAIQADRIIIPEAMQLTEFPCDPMLMQLAEDACRTFDLGAVSLPVLGRRPAIHKGTIVSGDQFVSDSKKSAWLRSTFGATATDMESAATAHVCHVNRVPFLAIRAISDQADHSAAVDVAAYLPIAAHNYHDVTLEIVRGWSEKRGETSDRGA
ncbi:MAG: 5'-methylthioadenosine/adenosylhomocysteine nucleosidase [Phycisphaerae bacterium]|nr:5'-methylthioadenosine/adenosylhomocysteine nucleosidase [Phycisphaerae bacterium]